MNTEHVISGNIDRRPEPDVLRDLDAKVGDTVQFSASGNRWTLMGEDIPPADGAPLGGAATSREWVRIGVRAWRGTGGVRPGAGEGSARFWSAPVCPGIANRCGAPVMMQPPSRSGWLTRPRPAWLTNIVANGVEMIGCRFGQAKVWCL